MSAIRITVLATLAVVLVGCNANERGRVVKLNKGVYHGAADTQLSDATREKLNERVAFQRFGADLKQRINPATPPEGKAVTIEGRVSGQNY